MPPPISRLTNRISIHAALALVVGLLGLVTAGVAAPRSLLLISIDGLRPDYISRASEHGLKIPALRALYERGVRAEGVRGVLPTATYPSHTSVITGVNPPVHGIISNHPFGVEVEGLDVWYYYSEDLKVPTLWDAAAAAGRTVGNVSWPVSVGAPAINYNVPEFALTRTDEDLKLTRGAATPGLMRELAVRAGDYITDNKKAVARDWARAKYALEIIRLKKPGLLTVHFAATDHFQHRLGPFHPTVNAALEEIDRMVGQLAAAMREADPAAAVCIGSDHGFSPVERLCYLDAAFVKAGLITLKSPGKSVAEAGIAKWVAQTWSAGGSAGVVLKDPQDSAAYAKVKAFLTELAANPDNGIARILEADEIRAMGGTTFAQFWVDMRPGSQIHPSLEANPPAPAIAMAVSMRGAHGYTPDHPEMNSTFVLAGAGIREGLDLPVIDMRSIAPTLAQVMGIDFSTAEAPALDVLKTSSSR
jgi:predicted AlkP superfamily pyrophosphatase or phosphodiesterase